MDYQTTKYTCSGQTELEILENTIWGDHPCCCYFFFSVLQYHKRPFERLLCEIIFGQHSNRKVATPAFLVSRIDWCQVGKEWEIESLQQPLQLDLCSEQETAKNSQHYFSTVGKKG